MDSEKGLTVKVSVSRLGNEPDGRQLRVRLFSEWINCSCTSGVFGSDTMTWNASETAESLYSSDYQANLEYNLSSDESLKVFNATPGIYAVFLNDGVPISFSYVDCSSFVMEAGTLAVKQFKLLDYSVDVAVSVKNPLVSLASAIKLEPVTIDIRK